MESLNYLPALPSVFFCLKLKISGLDGPNSMLISGKLDICLRVYLNINIRVYLGYFFSRLTLKAWDKATNGTIYNMNER